MGNDYRLQLIDEYTKSKKNLSHDIWSTFILPYTTSSEDLDFIIQIIKTSYDLIGNYINEEHEKDVRLFEKLNEEISDQNKRHLIFNLADLLKDHKELEAKQKLAYELRGYLNRLNNFKYPNRNKTSFKKIDVSQINLIELIQFEGFETRKAGKEHVMRCIFHDERSPSLYINPTKNLFHCFGCNTSGNAVQFIMKFKGYSFKDACKYIDQSLHPP